MAEETVVAIDSGKVRGQIQEDYHGGKFYSFSGIPFAKAPVGELRFKAPVPCDPWTGIKDGRNEGSECPNKDLFLHYHRGNEDNCLNLNVYTKELPKDENKKYPVMVFIHGGGFISGSNKSEIYGPHYLMTKNIVLVCINYRLGVLGFLSLDDPSLEVPGNAGLKDQVFALKWVQRNIHSFGGDANNVTIFGESAGSVSVHYLTLSPLAKGLFHKAIMQSGSALNIWARGRRNAKDIAQAMGYQETDEKTVLSKLRKASAKSLVEASLVGDTFDPCLVRPFGPVIEHPHSGAFLCEDPIDIIKAGKNHQVPIIMGYNSLEGLCYGFFSKLAGRTALQKNLELDVPHDLNIAHDRQKVEEVAKKIKEFYYKNADISEENMKYKYMLYGDVLFVRGIQKAALLLLQQGTAPLYVYRMNLETSMNLFKKLCITNYTNTFLVLTILRKMTGSFMNRMFLGLENKIAACNIEGVAHADELSYLFMTWITPKIIKGSEEDRYVQRFVNIWTNFAKYGDPTPEQNEAIGNVMWRPIVGEKLENFFVIDKTNTTSGNVESDRMAFWESLYQEYADVKMSNS